MAVGEYYPDGEPVTRYMIDHRVLTHPVLRYPYVVLKEIGSETSTYDKKCDDLMKKLDQLTLVELMKMSESEPPSESHKLKGQFPLAKTWTFFDEHVIEVLADAWWRYLTNKKTRKEGREV
jgi:hypothetical protein